MIDKGKRKPLKNVFIERKGKFLIDTRREKRKITLASLLKKKTKKKASPAQLKSLKKARAVKKKKRRLNK